MGLLLTARRMKREMNKDIDPPIIGSDTPQAKEERQREEAQQAYDLFYSLRNMSSHAFEISAFSSSLDHAFNGVEDKDITSYMQEEKLLPTVKMPVPYAYQEFQAVNVRTHVLAETMKDLNFQYQALMGRDSKNGFQPLANYRSVAHALAAHNGLSLADIDQIEQSVPTPKLGASIAIKAYHLASGKDGQDIISRHYELWVTPANTKIKPFLMESTIYKEGWTGGKGSEKNGFDTSLAKPRYAESMSEMLLAGEKQSADFADLNILNVTTNLDRRESKVLAHAAWEGDEYKLDYTATLPVGAKALKSFLKHKAIVDHINGTLKKHASLGAHTNANSCGNYIMTLLEEADVLPRPLFYDADSAPISVLPLDALEEAFLFAAQLRYQKKFQLTKGDGTVIDFQKKDSVWHSITDLAKAIRNEKLYVALPTSPSFFEKYCAAAAGYLYSSDEQLAERSPQQMSAAMVQALLTRDIRIAQDKLLDKNIPLEIEDLSKMEEVE